MLTTFFLTATAAITGIWYPKVADEIDWFRCERRDRPNHRESNPPPVVKRNLSFVVSLLSSLVSLLLSVYPSDPYSPND